MTGTVLTEPSFSILVLIKSNQINWTEASSGLDYNFWVGVVSSFSFLLIPTYRENE